MMAPQPEPSYGWMGVLALALGVLVRRRPVPPPPQNRRAGLAGGMSSKKSVTIDSSTFASPEIPM